MFLKFEIHENKTSNFMNDTAKNKELNTDGLRISYLSVWVFARNRSIKNMFFWLNSYIHSITHLLKDKAWQVSTFKNVRRKIYNIMRRITFIQTKLGHFAEQCRITIMTNMIR